MRTAERVAVLGGGIMGVTTALLLARRGVPVVLFEAAAEVMAGASRWNEGKIHLGYLYGADPTGATAAAVLGPGLAFRGIVEGLIDAPLAPHVTEEEDHYLVLPGSAVPPDAFAAHVARVSALLAGRHGGGYLGPLRGARALDPGTVAALSGGQALAGFAVPERSVDTRWLADRLCAAAAAEPRVELRPGTRVTAILPQEGGFAGPWEIRAGAGRHGPFRAVVNATWEGRAALDAGLGLGEAGPVSHRFRLSVFLRGGRALTPRVFALGPFGDVKSYGGGGSYLSWYPAGLVAEGHDTAPPPLPDPLPRAGVLADLRAGLGPLIPDLAGTLDAATELRVEGGWVFARGAGTLSDPAATLHRRDRFGIRREGSYVSVDTGKYSAAPAMAAAIAADLAP